MGAAGSRAAGRSYAALEQQAGSAAARQQLESAPARVAVDAQRAAEQHVQRENLSLVEEEQLESRDPGLASLLDRLGGSIHGKQVHVLPQQGDPAAKQPAAADDDSRGRLPPVAVAELFELQKQAAGSKPDIAHLIQRYQLDPALVDEVLAACCRPAIVEAPGSSGVAAFGQWPRWFKRHNL